MYYESIILNSPQNFGECFLEEMTPELNMKGKYN